MLRLVALVGLVALASCGSGQDPALDGAADTTSTTGGDVSDLALTIDLPGELVAGEPVTWRLTVTNATDEDVTLAFSSGQQGDVVLVDDDGAEAYRWSEGMMFSQALTEVPVPAGGEVTFDLPGELDVEPGPYTLEASVPSDPAPDAVTREVTVAG